MISKKGVAAWIEERIPESVGAAGAINSDHGAEGSFTVELSTPAGLGQVCVWPSGAIEVSFVDSTIPEAEVRITHSSVAGTAELVAQLDLLWARLARDAGPVD